MVVGHDDPRRFLRRVMVLEPHLLSPLLLVDRYVCCLFLPTGSRIGAGRYLGVSRKGRAREYFYSFFDPNPTEMVALGSALRARRALILLGCERLALCGPRGDLGPRVEPQFAKNLRN